MAGAGAGPEPEPPKFWSGAGAAQKSGGSATLLLSFQFYTYSPIIHYTFTYYTFSRLFKPPGSGSASVHPDPGELFIRIRANLDPQHWFPLVQNYKIIQIIEDPDPPIKERNKNWIFACFVDLYWDPRKVLVPPPAFAVFSRETGIWNGTPWWGLTMYQATSVKWSENI